MFHVPANDCWDPTFIAESLRHHDIDTCTVDDTVRITLPIQKPQHTLGWIVNWLFPARPVIATIAFRKDRFLRNIELQVDPLKFPLDSSWFQDICRAMRERDYVIGSDRRIATRYCSNQEIETLFDDLDRLESEKLDLVTKQDFANAAKIRDEEEVLRKRIDTILLSLVGDYNKAKENDEQ